MNAFTIMKVRLTKHMTILWKLIYKPVSHINTDNILYTKIEMIFIWLAFNSYYV